LAGGIGQFTFPVGSLFEFAVAQLRHFTRIFNRNARSSMMTDEMPKREMQFSQDTTDLRALTGDHLPLMWFQATLESSYCATANELCEIGEDSDGNLEMAMR
jgi:hypothetical protein